MFSQESVILSTGAGACMAGGCAWRLACMARGDMCSWWGGGVACVPGGMCGRVGMWQGCAWQGACVAGETTTAADGTHPTEMYSCFC